MSNTCKSLATAKGKDTSYRVKHLVTGVNYIGVQKLYNCGIQINKHK